MSTKPNPEHIDFTGVAWTKSSFSSGSGDCAELAEVRGFVAVRDSKNPDQTPLLFTHSEIRALLAGAKAGEFDHFIA